MKRIYFVFFSLLTWVSSLAQEQPVLSTYVFDPYLVNPAMITIDGFSQVNLVCRKQWTDIPNAPTTFGINGQFIVSPKISVGGIITYDRSVILTATTTLATFSYQVPFSTDHFINLGLSAGFYADRLRLDDLENVSDPALLTNESRFLAHGQFGMVYVYKNLRLGIAFPELFDKFTHRGDEGSKFSPIRANIWTLGYALDLSPDMLFEPFGLYQFDQNQNGHFEVGGLFNYKKVIKLGCFYRENVGMGVLTQLAPTEKLLIGYSFESRSGSQTAFGGSSHELQLKLRFGKKRVQVPQKAKQKTEPAKKQVPVPLPVDSARREEPAQATENVTSEKESTSDFTPTHPVTAFRKDEIETSKPDVPPFLVVGCFRSEQNAERLLHTIQTRYPNAGMGYIKSRQLYFVYAQTMSSGEDISVAAIQKIRQTTAFKDAWFMRIHDDH